MSFLTDFIDHLTYLVIKWQLKRKNQKVVIRGSCNMCGKCCQGICLYINGRWLKNKRHFYKAARKDEYLNRFEICGKTESGHLKFSCNCLNENGSCNDYENRPQLCRLFPAPSIFIQDGQLPDGCGFRMSTELDFEKILAKTINEKNKSQTHCHSDNTNHTKTDN